MSFFQTNVNPKKNKTGDCAFRAVGAATQLGWDTAYTQLCAVGFELKLDPTDPKVVEKVLVDNGFKVGTIRVTKGTTRPTVVSFAKEHPNWFAVVRLANHYCAIGNGNYVDTWDCGHKSVYKYWYKEV